MTDNSSDLSEFLPGLEPEVTRVPVFPSYEKAIAELQRLAVIDDTHAGICASILRRAAIADDPRSKGYTVNDALKGAHEEMLTLLQVAAAKGNRDWQELESWVASQQ
ncbi:hypothetical protein [Microbacterium sp. TNHR37B]|uniref:hypothetical protein n=1 Tax=Microbacterium sp. TNHR37B TaxID=1775956 RepID=UPI0007B28958|nr:hypothetical protein [Microbacterium sp. TNHR37B]KZE91188.1 hypothetical protein AVP41_00723 [Microbacterium sp. TNHR37B]